MHRCVCECIVNPMNASLCLNGLQMHPLSGDSTYGYALNLTHKCNGCQSNLNVSRFSLVLYPMGVLEVVFSCLTVNACRVQLTFQRPEPTLNHLPQWLLSVKLSHHAGTIWVFFFDGLLSCSSSIFHLSLIPPLAVSGFGGCM